MTTHSIGRIISFVNSLQEQLTLEKVLNASQSPTALKELHDNLLQQITSALEGIEGKLTASGLTAADLAVRSRRAYQWLKFLSLTGNLSTHLDALQRINLFLPKMKKVVGKSCIVYQIGFYHQSALYKVDKQGSQVETIAQESFCGAPDSVLIPLLELSLDPSNKGARAVLRDYAFSEEYRIVRKYLEYLAVPPDSFAAGQLFNLGDSYERVNQEYFLGKLGRPHLTWSSRLTHRKFGHYQWDTDTVMISKALDQPGVPEIVIDFVVYHELLHKKLGVKKTKHNRIAHTQAFREAEERFTEIKKARQHLNRIAKKRARSK